MGSTTASPAAPPTVTGTTPGPITVTALFFASYADALGRDALPVTLGVPATVADVVARVRALPGGDRVPAAPLTAVNAAYARGDRVLAAGDEVAFIPPVAGG